MMFVVCITCRRALRVESLEDAELDSLVGPHSEFYPDKYPCPFPGCNQKAQAVDSLEVSQDAAPFLTVVDVTPQEAFIALNGMGLPRERSCYLENVRELMKIGVKNVVGKNLLGTPRCIVDYLEMEDGSRVYLGASAEGATVYRVTQHAPYVKNLEENDG